VLGSSDLVGFVATTDLARAKAFYGELLGLEHLRSSPVAHVLNANGTTLRISLVEEITVAPYTVLGWSVTNIEETIRALNSKGVRFERFPGMNQGRDRHLEESRAGIEWPGSRTPMATPSR